MKSILLALGVILAPCSFADEADSQRFPKQVIEFVDQIRPNMSHADLLALIKRNYPKARSIGEMGGGGGVTLNFDLDGRYSLSLAEVEDLRQKEPNRFVHPDANVRVYDRKNKWTLERSFGESKKPATKGKAGPQTPANKALQAPAGAEVRGRK